jgi:hypothetical protein
MPFGLPGSINLRDLWHADAVANPASARRKAAVHLRRAISIQAKGKELLNEHAIAPSAARLSYIAREPKTKLYALSLASRFPTACVRGQRRA